MRRLALALGAWCLVGCGGVSGQVPPPASPSPLAQAGLAFRALGQLFGSLNALQYSAVIVNSVKGQPDFVTEVHYVGSGPQYRWTVRRPEPSTGLLKEYTAAYNGETGYYLRAHMGLLEIHQNERPNDFELAGYTGPLEAFRFFLADFYHEDSPVNLPTLAQFRQSVLWDAYPGQILKAEIVPWAGKNALEVTLPGGLMPSRLGETTYRLYFPMDGSPVPLGWERLWANGTYRETYNVQEFDRVAIPGTGKFFVYPKVAVHTGFWGKDTEPSFRETITVKEVGLNTSPSADQFEVDPAEAQQIEDMRTKVFIPVPK